VEVAVTTLQENMPRFLHSLSVILSAPPEDVGGLTLDTVEVSAQIDGKGNISMIGAGTAEMAVPRGSQADPQEKGLNHHPGWPPPSYSVTTEVVSLQTRLLSRQLA